MAVRQSSLPELQEEIEQYKQTYANLMMYTTVQIPETATFCDLNEKALRQSFPRKLMDPDLGNSPLPLFLKFKDVKFQVEARQSPAKPRISVPMKSFNHSGHKPILKGLTGSVCPGEILALMGPSGSGKTSLLKILGGRLHGGVTGEVTYNDAKYSSALKRRIGFVSQDDLLFPQLTVKETLVFAALLRLPRAMTYRQKVKRAEIVIRDLGLENCQNTRVGGLFVPGISGGERKRTSIGFEILVDPSLLLLDEPTSGLDSSTALKLLQVLHKNAKAGRTIITTIHQPSSRLFHMFDKLILISEGHPIYSGQAKEAMKYFSTLQFVPQLAMNPADFLLDLATGNVKDITLPQELQRLQDTTMWETKVEEASSCRRQLTPAAPLVKSNSCHRKLSDHIQVFNEATSINPDLQGTEQEFSREIVKYLRTKYKSELEDQEKMKSDRLGKVRPDLQAAIQVKRNWTSSWLTQFIVLSKRTLRERAREYIDLLRMVQAIGVALLLGLLWWKSNIDTEAQLRDQVGLLFYICIFWSTSSIFSSVYIFPLERDYLAKERAADMYRLSAYHISSTICDIPSQLLYPTIFITIIYFMTGFRRSAETFILTQLSVHLIVITGQGIGEMFGAAILDIKKAGTIASLVLLIFLLTGGYYVQHIPGFIRWLKYASFVFYGFRLLLKVQYSPAETYECSEPGGCKSLQESPSFAGIVDLNGGIMESWILIVMAVVFRVFAYIFLRRIKIQT